MGFLDKLKNLAIPYDDEDEEFLDGEQEQAPQEEPFQSDPWAAPQEPRQPQMRQAAPAPAPSAARSPFYEYSVRPATVSAPPSTPAAAPAAAAAPARDGKVVNIHSTIQLQVVLVKPDRFEAAADIADNLREKRTVVVNLEHTAKDVARRLLDFLSGVCYAQDGKIKKIAVSTYIITPFNVDIMGDLIDELENNGLYF